MYNTDFVLDRYRCNNVFPFCSFTVTLFFPYPPYSLPALSKALKNMYSNRDDAMPKPSNIWPVRFRVALNVVEPEFS